jgi:hypothetical protein
MLDLFDEFKALIGALESNTVDYAVCGGLAMAIHALPRATIDIDLLVRTEDLPTIIPIVKHLGYTFEAAPMRFRKGEIEIRRISKIDPDSDDTLTLDLLLVTPATESAWASRTSVDWEDGVVRVVSREGLIALKSLRNSGQDRDDIELLNKDDDES